MADGKDNQLILMYTLNYDKQNYPLCSLKVLVEKNWTLQFIKPTNKRAV